MIRSGSSCPSAFPQALAAAAAAAGGGLVLLKLFPSLELGLFAAGSARLASLFTGQPVLRIGNGWMLPDADLSIVVTAGCSATDFFLMVATLLAWHFAGKSGAAASAGMIPPDTASLATTSSGHAVPFLCRGTLLPIIRAALGGLAIALPLSIFLNSLRVVVVAQAHRWFIDHFPASYGPFLHMATGVAIFLPSLIALNGLLHLLAPRPSLVSASA